MADHTVTDGDCAESIAAAHGLTVTKLWLHARNDSLRQTRKSPHLLKPGDVLFIPEPESRDEAGNTETRHRFRRKNVPSKLILVLKRNGKPAANKPFRIWGDGLAEDGTLDGEGKLEVSVPPQMTEATLEVEGWSNTLSLMLGGLDPIDEVSGYQARLHNLGFAPGPIDDVDGPMTQAGVKRFQMEAGVTVDGIVGPETIGHLEKAYGC